MAEDLVVGFAVCKGRLFTFTQRAGIEMFKKNRPWQTTVCETIKREGEVRAGCALAVVEQRCPEPGQSDTGEDGESG